MPFVVPERTAIDGRQARSERTRALIVDALLALLEGGDPQPSTERIADAAGVSRRALFNHFRDVEDLLAAAGDRQVARVLPTLRVIPPGGTTAARVSAYAAQITSLYARVAPVRRAALLAARSSPTIAERMRVARGIHRASLELTFGPELAAARRRDETIAALVAATSFGAWEDLATHQALPHDEVERAVRRMITGVFAEPPFKETEA